MGFRIEHEEGGEGLGGEGRSERAALYVHVGDACESCRVVKDGEEN